MIEGGFMYPLLLMQASMVCETHQPDLLNLPAAPVQSQACLCQPGLLPLQLLLCSRQRQRLQRSAHHQACDESLIDDRTASSTLAALQQHNA